MHTLRSIAFGLALLVQSLASSSSLAAGESSTLAPIPEAISSFGAAVVDHHVYVFGVHLGRVPGNSLDALSRYFVRLDLKAPEKGWEELPMHVSSQSPGLVGWNGKVYRIGGLSFHNKAGDDTSFHSLDTFAVYDPAQRSWKELAPLPSPRSSHDAAVIDGKLYVVGGWNLQNESSDSAQWHSEALVFDLSDENGAWKTIAKPPFETRALATAVHQGKLYSLGGMTSKNNTTRDVFVYDPQQDSWSPGPELETGGDFGGFAISAFGAGGKLYYSGGTGTVYSLNDKGNGWVPGERLLFSRMFHRLVVGPDGKVIVIGGVAGRTYLNNVEVVAAAGERRELKLAEWSLKFPGKARHSQVLLLNSGTLYAFGGNTSPEPHHFKSEAFTNEAFSISLANGTVDQLAPLPVAVQAGAAVLSGSRLDPSVFVMGGLVSRDDKPAATNAVQQYRIRSRSWVEEVAPLPSARSMFGVAEYEQATWLFGGANGRELVGETLRWASLEGGGYEVMEPATLPVKRRSFGAAVVGSKFYAVGGLGADMKVVGSADVYDFQTGTWSQVAAPHTPRVFPHLVALKGKLYLSGGFAPADGTDGHFGPVKTIEVFDPQTNTWTETLSGLPGQVASMTMFAWQDRLLFYGLNQEQGGEVRFVLVDPSPNAQGYGEVPASQSGEPTPGSELIAQLKTLDKNGDGNVSLEEVGARFRPLIIRIDADKDGIASAEEIKAFAAREDEKRPAPGVGPGGAAGGPRRGPGAEPQGNPAEAAKRLLEERDADKDGLLKGDEIPEQMRARVEQLDTNKDGAISLQELEASFPNRRPRGEGRPSP